MLENNSRGVPSTCVGNPRSRASRPVMGCWGDRSSRTPATTSSWWRRSAKPSLVASLREAKPGGIAPRSQALPKARRGAMDSAVVLSAPRCGLSCCRATRAAGSPVTAGSQRHSHEDWLSCAPDTSDPPRSSRSGRLTEGARRSLAPPGEPPSMRKGVMDEAAVPAHPRALDRRSFISAFRSAPATSLYARALVSGPSCSPGSTATCRPSILPPALSTS